MVYEPGGYVFMDYIKLGGPLQVVCGIFTVAIVSSIQNWWAYTVALAIACPIVVVFFFFFGGDKGKLPHELESDIEQASGVKNGSGFGKEVVEDASSETPFVMLSEYKQSTSDVVFHGSA
jgi:hypothetical protein